MPGLFNDTNLALHGFLRAADGSCVKGAKPALRIEIEIGGRCNPSIRFDGSLLTSDEDLGPLRAYELTYQWGCEFRFPPPAPFLRFDCIVLIDGERGKRAGKILKRVGSQMGKLIAHSPLTRSTN